MNVAITEAPTGTTMILRALARFPERMAFVWDDGSLTYRATLDLIGRLQAAMAAAGLAKGQTVALLSANSAETWCAGVAASGLGLVTIWLHPLGALADHLDVIEDAEASALIVDPKTHAQRGGELAANARPPPCPWRSPPTSSFLPCRVISQRRRSPTSPAPRSCPRCCAAARC